MTLTQRPVGELLRQWREQRRLSQLALSLQADISTRHLSFMETGRSSPSRDMVLRLAEELEVPLRDRNRLLLAAGYAPVYGETSLDAPEMAAVKSAVRRILAGHEPYPACVVDRQWNLVDSNAAIQLLLTGVAPELLAPPVNVLRLSLHPQGMAPRIRNLGEWRAHLLGRLRREITVTADEGLSRLHQELVAYPCDDPETHPEDDVVVPLRIAHNGTELAFLSIVATFGTPADITVAELSIESFYPADDATARALVAFKDEQRR
ncbi:transcriptional regulator with XRE-family HTH domain [Kibdelosporangium phytohabitans]|uniref:XRE family transcriptional regulator n=1 Tax=Kibdelosporangium phytohabitans TaxID=860235 RepID=A0A0N9IH69_9PSEU|nr:helix-turn-helix transcriptional regulator [Kibdelosporangium phytohabitans]ALG14690.1 XRE family transcriptional regulator [Kibdelosporangium phytohabitans]MBE1471791.1 transcriptional regulator with XRE-family HTH domain [Kibdelosporangium phytohabitans]